MTDEATRLALRELADFIASASSQDDLVTVQIPIDQRPDVVSALRAASKAQEPVAWQPIETAPRDGRKILYWNKFNEIGHCIWCEAASAREVSCWWDEEKDDEVAPLWWRPSLSSPQPLYAGDTKSDGRTDEAKAGDVGAASGSVRPATIAANSICENHGSADEAGVGSERSSPSEPIAQGQREAFKPITMQDIRLVAGEGKLPAWAVLDACNIIVRQRLATLPQSPVGACREALEELRGLFDGDGRLFCSGDYQLEVIARVDAALAPSAQEGETAHSGTYLGYKNEQGHEMHCANAFCPHQDKCRRGCSNRVARASMVTRPMRGGEA